MSHSDLPDWLIEAITDARRLFGVGDNWRITGVLQDDPGQDRDSDAACMPDVVYFNAELEFARDLANDERGRRVVMHEILHIAHSEIDWVIKSFVGDNEIAWQMYEDSVERFLQCLTRGMVRHIAPIQDKSDGDANA